MEDEELVGMEESEDDVILDDDEDEEEEEDSIQVVAGRAIKSILSTPHLAASIDSGCDISRSSTPHPIVASSIDSTRTLFTVKPSPRIHRPLHSTWIRGFLTNPLHLHSTLNPLSMKPITASPDGIRQPPTLPIHIRQHQRHVASSFPPPLSPKRKPGEEGKRQRKRVSLTPGMSTWWNVLMFGGQ
ncbi:hypothetical protein BC829DRAFT_415796 [Chytridium lagenaria]|nr:hypothetical protein BC829DRAFT_415796 [Chytridium lagenaria]